MAGMVFLMEVIGTIIGALWGASFVYKDFRQFYYHKKDIILYIKSFSKCIGTDYFAKLFGKSASGIVLFGRELRVIESVFGKTAARYGTLGIGSEAAFGAMKFPLAIDQIMLYFWVILAIAEVVLAVRKDHNLLYNKQALGTLLLEVFVTFSIIGVITDTFVWA